MQQMFTRCFKFHRFCCEDEEEFTFDIVDLNLCSLNFCSSLSSAYKTNASLAMVGVCAT